MEFYVNNEKIDVTLEGEETVADVLKSFEITCEQNDAAVIGITINNQKVTEDTFDEIAAKKLDKNEKFEFSVVTKQTIVDSFKELSTLFYELSEKMEQIPVDLQSGRDEQAHKSIKILADRIEDFCHVAALSSLFEDFAKVQINGEQISSFFSEFSPILKDFEQALKDNDTITVGDLAEYEICPRLKQIAKTLEELT